MRLSQDGAITIEEARSVETSLDVVEGFRFDSGYLSPKFITDERRGVVRYENPLFFVTDAKLESVEEMLPVLEVVAREGRPLIIVAEEVEGQALAALIMNSIRGSLKVAAVKAPKYGEERRGILQDLAIATGAAFISRESNIPIKATKLEHLGTSVETQGKSLTELKPLRGRLNRRIIFTSAKGYRRESPALPAGLQLFEWAAQQKLKWLKSATESKTPLKLFDPHN